MTAMKAAVTSLLFLLCTYPRGSECLLLPLSTYLPLLKSLAEKWHCTSVTLIGDLGEDAEVVRTFSEGGGALAVQNAATATEVTIGMETASELYAFVASPSEAELADLADRSRSFSLQGWVMPMAEFEGREDEFRLRLDSRLYLAKATGESEASAVGIYEAYAFLGQVRKGQEKFEGCCHTLQLLVSECVAVAFSSSLGLGKRRHIRGPTFEELV